MDRDTLAEQLFIGMAHLMNTRTTQDDNAAMAVQSYDSADALIAEKEAQKAKLAATKKAAADRKADEANKFLAAKKVSDLSAQEATNQAFAVKK